MAVERHNYCKNASQGGLVPHIDRRIALLGRPVMLGQQVEFAEQENTLMVPRALAEQVRPVMELLVLVELAPALPNLEPQEGLAWARCLAPA